MYCIGARVYGVIQIKQLHKSCKLMDIFLFNKNPVKNFSVLHLSRCREAEQAACKRKLSAKTCNTCPKSYRQPASTALDALSSPTTNSTGTDSPLH
jgi:hypothetical protein